MIRHLLSILIVLLFVVPVYTLAEPGTGKRLKPRWKLGNTVKPTQPQQPGQKTPEPIPVQPRQETQTPALVADEPAQEPMVESDSEQAPVPQPPLKNFEVQGLADDFFSWQTVTLGDKSCRVSPVISFARDYEINHHTVTITFTGSGTVELSVGHYSAENLQTVCEKKHLHSRFQKVISGEPVKVSSGYKNEHFAWLFIATEGAVNIQAIDYSGICGIDTLYGHAPGVFKFAGGRLPYRLMYPRNYDPQKSYPLVLSVSGSGGVGSDNVKNMEMVIYAKSAYTQYYEDEQLECFSLVPQIPPNEAIPSPYWPKGTLGKPTPEHPDWAAVNEQGWYAQASVALIKYLVESPELNIDPQRIYYTGFSYGGKACWEFLKAAPDLFAAAICGGGWPIGPAYSNPTGLMREKLKEEVKRYQHIPVRIFAGEKDPMRQGSQAVAEELQALNADAIYKEFPDASHVATAGKIWSDKNNLVWLFGKKLQ